MSVATSSMMFEEIAIPQQQDLSNKTNPELEQFIGELFATIYLLHDKLRTFQSILKNESESKAELQKELDHLKSKTEAAILKPIENQKVVQNSTHAVKDPIRRIPDMKVKENPKVKENSNVMKRPAPEINVAGKKPRIPVTVPTATTTTTITNNTAASKVKPVPTRISHSIPVAKVQTKVESKVNTNIEVPSNPVHPTGHATVHTAVHNNTHTTTHSSIMAHTTGSSTVAPKIPKPITRPVVPARPSVTKVPTTTINTSNVASRLHRTNSKVMPTKPKEESKIADPKNGKSKPTTGTLPHNQKVKELPKVLPTNVKDDAKILSVNNETTPAVDSPVPIETLSAPPDQSKHESRENEIHESPEDIKQTENKQENMISDHMDVEVEPVVKEIPIEEPTNKEDNVQSGEPLPEDNHINQDDHMITSEELIQHELPSDQKGMEVSEGVEKDTIVNEVIPEAELPHEVSHSDEKSPNGETMHQLLQETPESSSSPSKTTTNQFLNPPDSPDLSPDEPELSYIRQTRETKTPEQQVQLEVTQPEISISMVESTEPTTPSFSVNHSFSLYGMTPKQPEPTITTGTPSPLLIISPNFKLSFEDDGFGNNSDKTNKYLDYLFPSPTISSPQKKFTPTEPIHTLPSTDDVIQESSIDL